MVVRDGEERRNLEEGWRLHGGRKRKTIVCPNSLFAHSGRKRYRDAEDVARKRVMVVSDVAEDAAMRGRSAEDATRCGRAVAMARKSQQWCELCLTPLSSSVPACGIRVSCIGILE
jgi:hypothetical protein